MCYSASNRHKASKTDMAKDTTGRLHVTVKTGGKRKLSSKLWLERQLNDPYVAQAKRDGFRSRAAYKLLEIDDKHHFLKQGITVVDLGAAPGGGNLKRRRSISRWSTSTCQDLMGSN